MQIHNLEQGTPEWFAVRKGKMTASHAQAIGNCGKGLDTYIVDLMSEFYSSGEKEHFSNKHTERGNEQEPVARAVYELETGEDVQEVGFIEQDEFVGVSPDGLVKEDGGLEIKSIQDKDYFRILIGEDGPDTKHVWQVQMNLMVTGRKWWDLMYYNPNYQKSNVIFRIYPDEEKFAELRRGIEIGKGMINNIKAKIGE